VTKVMFLKSAIWSLLKRTGLTMQKQSV